MSRALGLVLGGVSFATLAAVTVATSGASTGAGSAAVSPWQSSGITSVSSSGPAVRTLAYARVPASSFTGRVAGHQAYIPDGNGPLISVQTVSGVTPNAGQSGPGGEQAVVISGSGFTGVTDVAFGGTDVTSIAYPCLPSPGGCFTVVSDTEIDADTPTESAATVDVIVTGGSAAAGDQYSFVDPPTVTNVTSPQNEGATGIAVTGSNFSDPTDGTNGVSQVELNPVGMGSNVTLPQCASAGDPQCFTFVDDGDLTINLPASMMPRQYDTVVTAIGGVSMTSPSDRLTVVTTPPTLTSINPSSGPSAGGNQVVLTGTGFTGATNVNVGALNVSSSNFTVDSDTQITIPSFPAHAAGGVLVSVDTPGGTSNTQSYTYNAVPTLTNLSPSSGPIAGGNQVVLTGTDFTGATNVNVGAINVSSSNFTVDSATQITIPSFPAHAAGGVSVSVDTPNGTSNIQTYTYNAVPTLTNLSPSSGPIAGGNQVVLTGTDFTGATNVNVGAINVSSSNFTVDSATQITIPSFPAHAAGGVSVSVDTPNGTSNTQPYTYNAAPTLTSVNPSSGPTAGGNQVVLTGTDFTGATNVNVGAINVSSSNFTVDSATQITVPNFPAHAAGGVAVSVDTPDGTSTTQTYTYDAVPTLTSLSSTSGPTSGSTVTLTGTGFNTATDVNVGSHDITNFTINSDTSITANFPANAAGPVSVTVTNPGGTSTPALTYTYLALPTVTAVSPSAGPTSGGNTVTLTGTAFTGATDVFADTADIAVSPCPVSPVSSCFTVNSPTSITVEDFPAHAAGTIDITVAAAGGTSMTVTADRYAYAAAPTVTNVTPNAGLPSGGNTVTVTGTSFMSGTLYTATQVSVGSTHLSACGTAPCFTVTGPSSITITGMPPGTAGTTVHITVTVLGVTSNVNASDQYTYTAGVPAVTSVLPRNGSTNGNENVQIVGSNFENAGSPFTTMCSSTPPMYPCPTITRARVRRMGASP